MTLKPADDWRVSWGTAIGDKPSINRPCVDGPSVDSIEPDSSAVVPWDTYSRALKTHFRRHLKSDVDLDDLVQEVFTKLAALPNDRHIEFPKAYIFRIASNILVDRSRGRQNALNYAVSLDDETQLTARAEQEDCLHYRDLEKTLNMALDTLGDNCRDAFILRRYHNMNTSQIAAKLKISHRMVQKHIAIALVKIQEHIRDATALSDRHNDTEEAI